MLMSQDRTIAEAVLVESRVALDVLARLVTKLELYVDQVEHELDRRAPGEGDTDARK